jgi:cupin 2 domain-containing protein
MTAIRPPNNSTMPIDNLFDRIPAQLPEEITETLLSASGIRIERIVSAGHASPDGFWYDQTEHEWVVLLAGEAGLEIKGEAVRSLKPGDFLLLNAHRKHRVAWTKADTDTIWLAVFFS